MSKSLGNGIDPLEIIEQYGADALRLTLVTGNAPGNDMRYSEKKISSVINGIYGCNNFREIVNTFFNVKSAVAKLNDFIWEEFCDWYIEMVKPRLYNEEDTLLIPIWRCYGEMLL